MQGLTYALWSFLLDCQQQLTGVMKLVSVTDFYESADFQYHILFNHWSNIKKNKSPPACTHHLMFMLVQRGP